MKQVSPRKSTSSGRYANIDLSSQSGTSYVKRKKPLPKSNVTNMAGKKSPSNSNDTNMGSEEKVSNRVTLQSRSVEF